MDINSSQFEAKILDFGWDSIPKFFNESGATSYFGKGIGESFGINALHGEPNIYTGWGRRYDFTEALSHTKVTTTHLGSGSAARWSYGTSALQGGSTLFFLYQGLANEGLLGLGKAALSELVSSSAQAHVGGLLAEKAAATAALRGAVSGATKGASAANPLVWAGSILGGFAGETVGGIIGLPQAGWTVGTVLGTYGAYGLAMNPELYPIAAGVAAVAGTGYAAYKGAEFAFNASYGIMKRGLEHRRQKLTSIETAGSTAAFLNKGAFTMRSRAVQAINKHQLNARSALGQEANLSHFNAYRRYSYNPNY
jgi:hypothetical protein